MQKLSKRLQAVSEFVTTGNCVADIGTDHAYLPIYLVQSGRCPKAAALDIRPGPLERARANIRAAGLENCIQTRLSDGLQKLEPSEADTVVIAGMGGLTVIKIMEAAMDLLPHIKEMVLEPQSDVAKVRKFLRERHMYIDREDLVFEDAKFYPVLHVVWKKQTDAGSARAQRIEFLKVKIPETNHLQKALDQYGEYLICNRHPVLYQMLERDQKVKRQIMDSLTGGRQREKNAVRRQELERQLEDIRILQGLYLTDSAAVWAQDEL